MRLALVVCIMAIVVTMSGCAGPELPPAPGRLPKVLVSEAFLADIVKQVAGDRLTVETLMPPDADSHTFVPSPKDMARLADADLIVINGAGYEEWLVRVLASESIPGTVIQASAGLQTHGGDGHDHGGVDPHLWLNPLNVIRYVENIRDSLSAQDSPGQAIYAANAEAYIGELRALDAEIEQTLSIIPPEHRLLVTNHESLGYFAERYGFRVIGSVIPSVSTEAAPSARQLADLVQEIRVTGVRAIFIEQGANTDLAESVAREAGIAVVADLYTHTLVTSGDGPRSYIEMMQHNAARIAEALGDHQGS
ncbi:MAG: zinc ABC transporter substrate-binding protein [Chloroflexi bacterium]|nr:zinc ABC transporter substrate-binding protein [Chloroflexota bacterium]